MEASELTAGLLVHSRTRPSAPALRVEERTLSYAELDDRARRVSHALHRLGVRRGDRVAVLVPNGAEWFEAAHGCGRLGAVVVPVNTHFKRGEVGWIVRDSAARAVVAGASLLPALADVDDVPRLVVGASTPDGYDGALAAAPASGEVDAADAIGDAWPTTMAYTSGTTGRPKGIAMGAGDFRRFAAGWAAMSTRWGITQDDVHLMVGPAYHAGPFAWAQMHLAVGAAVVVMPRWDARRCLDLIERWRVTTTHMVPANFTRILELPAAERARADLSSLRMVIHAAAPCPVPLKRAFMDFVGADRVWEYYGASEGGGTVISPQEWLAHPGSVGRPYPGNEFVILDDDGNELPPGAVGTVYCRPAESSFEYHNDPDKTAASRRGGFFTVGDAGWLDEEGYLYLADRKSDMVISGGVNIYPREIEDVLFRHPDVVDCAVLGVPDERWGEALLAIVQPRRGADLDAEAVRAWVREHLADYKQPRHVRFVEELPRDPNGKVRKPVLRREWAAGAAPTP